MRLDREALFILHVENQNVVAYFKREAWYEFAMVLRTSAEVVVKMVSKRAAAHYTHPNSYCKLPTSHTVSIHAGSKDKNVK